MSQPAKFPDRDDPTDPQGQAEVRVEAILIDLRCATDRLLFCGVGEQEHWALHRLRRAPALHAILTEVATTRQHLQAVLAELTEFDSEDERDGPEEE
jgi:hypothetical protein